MKHIRFYKGLTYRSLSVIIGPVDLFISIGQGGLEVNLTVSREW